MAYVTSVKPSGCAVLIPRLGLEGFIGGSRDPNGVEVHTSFDDETKTLYRHRPDGEPWALRTFSRGALHTLHTLHALRALHALHALHALRAL